MCYTIIKHNEKLLNGIMCVFFQLQTQTPDVMLKQLNQATRFIGHQGSERK